MNSKWRALTHPNSMGVGMYVAYTVSVILLVAGVPVADLLTGLLIFTVFPEIAFVVIYKRLFNWRSTEIGQTLMVKSIGLAGVLTLAAVRAVFGDYPYREHIVYAFFLFIAVGVTYRIPAMFKEQPNTWAAEDQSTGEPAN